MAGSTRRDLFLQVSANVDGMTSAMKIGRTALLSLGGAAGDVKEEVSKAFAQLGANSTTGLKDVEAQYKRTYAAIRSNAEAVLRAPSGASALKIIDSAAAEQAAVSAGALAGELRITADAAAVVAKRAGDAGVAERGLAVAFETQAVEAERSAIALRKQAEIMGAVSTEARVLGAAEDHVDGAHKRMGMSGMMAEHVVRAMSDSIAAGQSPVRALTMEMGRITEAMTFFAMESNATTGIVGKFASFMGGGWGIAISAAIAVFAPMVIELLKGNDALGEAVKKLRDHGTAAGIDAQANAIWANSIDGVIEKTRNLTEELKKQLQTQMQVQAAAEDSARGSVSNLYNKRASFAQGGYNQTVDDIAAQRAEIARSKAALAATLPGAPGQTVLAANIVSAEQKLSDLEKRRGNLVKVINVAERNLRGASITRLDREADERADPGKRAAGVYEAKIGPLRDQFQAGTISVEKYNAALDAAKAKLTAANEEAANAKHLGRGDAAASNQATDVAYMSAFLKREMPGVRITSTTGGKHVANSDHYKGHALDFVPAGGVGSMTKDQVRALFEDNGLRIRRNAGGVEQLFGPGDKGHSDHFHVAWEGRAPTGATLAKRDQAGVSHAANDDRAYQGEVATVQARVARANLALADTTENRLAVSLDELTFAKEQRDKETADKLTAGGYGDPKSKTARDRAAGLTTLNGQAYGLDVDVAKKKEGDDLLNRQLSVDRAELSRGITLLNLQGDLAVTNAERKRIALQILAGQEREARATLAAAIAKEDDPVLKTSLQADLANLGPEFADKRKLTERQYQGPVGDYREQLTAHVGDMNTALNGVKADGLKGLEDGLVGIISGTETVAGAFKKMAASIISDIARIAVEKLILSVVGGGFGLKDGGLAGFANGGLPGFAGGGNPFVDKGIIRGAGTGRSDSIMALVGGRKPILVSNGEGIVNERAVRAHWPMIDAMNKGTFPAFAGGGLVSADRIYMRSMPSMASVARPSSQREVVYVQVDKSALFDVHVQRIAAPMAQAAMIGGSQQALQDLGEARMQTAP